MPIKIRRSLWYTSLFLAKYKLQIIVSCLVAVSLGLIFTLLQNFLPKPKNVYYFGLIGQYSSSQLPEVVVTFLNSGLTTIDSKEKVYPNLSTGWQVSEDGKSYTFTLKPNLLWSDGSSVTLSDINFNIRDVAFSTKDPDQLIFNLPAKFAPFPSILNFPISSKSGLLSSPYTVKVKQKSSGVITDIVLESKRDIYYLKVYPTSSLALTSYKLGEIDAILEIPSFGINSLPQTTGLTQTNVNYRQTALLYFNHQDPLLKEKSIRQGLAYLIKDKSFSNERAMTTLSTNSWAFNPVVKNYQYDPERGKKLITDSLSPETKNINLELSTIPELLPIAETIKQDLQSDLVSINIKVVTGTPQSFQLFLGFFDIPSDPDQYSSWHSTQNRNISHINSEKLDKYLEDGRTTIDLDDRKQLYYEFQRIFAEELPALPLFYPKILFLARNSRFFDIITLMFYRQNLGG